MKTVGVSMYAITKELEAVMSTTAAKTLPVSPKRYAECYDQFIASSNEYKMIAHALSHALLTNPYISPSRGISILDIGSGRTSIARQLPSHLTDRITRFTAYEPNLLFHEAWTSRHSFKNLDFPATVIAASFTTKTPCMTSCWDVIIFSHSLYHMKDKEGHINHALTLLSDSGFIFIVHQASLCASGRACTSVHGILTTTA